MKALISKLLPAKDKDPRIEKFRQLRARVQAIETRLDDLVKLGADTNAAAESARQKFNSDPCAKNFEDFRKARRDARDINEALSESALGPGRSEASMFLRTEDAAQTVLAALQAVHNAVSAELSKTVAAHAEGFKSSGIEVDEVGGEHLAVTAIRRRLLDQLEHAIGVLSQWNATSSTSPWAYVGLLKDV